MLNECLLVYTHHTIKKKKSMKERWNNSWFQWYTEQMFDKLYLSDYYLYADSLSADRKIVILVINGVEIEKILRIY